MDEHQSPRKRKQGRPKGSRNKAKPSTPAKQTPSAPALNTKRGRPLTPLQKELILQVYFTKGTIAGTARECGISIATAHRVITEANNDPALLAGRARALDSLAGQVHDVAERVVQSIAPEELETSFHAKSGPQGNFIGWSTRGPSLKDKAFAIGVLTDKLKILQAARHELLNPQDSGLDDGQRIMMFPQSVAEARSLIAQKVKRLRIMDVEFRVGDEDTTKRVDQLAQKAKLTDQEIADADESQPDPVSLFDG